MSAYGLQTHIWDNNLKSTLLLAGFPVLLLLLTYGLFLLFAGLVGVGNVGDGGDSVAAPFVWAAQEMGRAWPFALIGAGLWFTIAYLFNQEMIDAAVGAREVERRSEPELYNTLENLCISRGIVVPHLRIIETDALNAFASGVREKAYSITVTRGLMQTLSHDELETVLAHELTHIRNRDVRLLVIAVVFVGIFSFVGEIVFRGLLQGGWAPRRRSSSGGNEKGSGGAALAIIVALVLIAVSFALAVVIRFALSRRREFLADAGAVELTKNPDAMISALRKISVRPDIPHAPDEVREMFIENTHRGFGDLFATHPPIEKRIEALIAYAGGRDAPPGGPSIATAQNRAPLEGGAPSSSASGSSTPSSSAPGSGGASRPGPWDDGAA